MESSVSEPKAKQVKPIPRGKPKSGRVWKTTRTERYSAIMKVKPLRSSWEKKMRIKSEQKSVKDFAKRLRDEEVNAKREKRERGEENKRRRLENERKAEIVQPIKNTAKIKRMKKKQLRQIAKR